MGAKSATAATPFAVDPVAKQLEQVKLLLDWSPAGLFLTDVEGCCAYMNAHAKAICQSDPGASRPELLLHADFVRSLARALVGAEGDDLAQESWLRAMQAPAPMRKPSWTCCCSCTLSSGRSISGTARKPISTGCWIR